jgi:hypothetical protein
MRSSRCVVIADKRRPTTSLGGLSFPGWEVRRIGHPSAGGRGAWGNLADVPTRWLVMDKLTEISAKATRILG